MLTRSRQELLELMKSRRTSKWLETGHVSLEEVLEALRVATSAPSAHNTQPWRFVIINDEHVRDRLLGEMSAEWKEDLVRDGQDPKTVRNILNAGVERTRRASVLIVACLTMEDMDAYPDEKRQNFEYVMGVQSVAAAIQNLLLAIHALGLAACWRCSALFAPNSVKKVLGLPPELEPQALVEIGLPPSRVRQPSRKRLEDVVHLNRWGGSVDNSLGWRSRSRQISARSD